VAFLCPSGPSEATSQRSKAIGEAAGQDDWCEARNSHAIPQGCNEFDQFSHTQNPSAVQLSSAPRFGMPGLYQEGPHVLRDRDQVKLQRPSIRVIDIACLKTLEVEFKPNQCPKSCVHLFL
jgi:hypothetical protein